MTILSSSSSGRCEKQNERIFFSFLLFLYINVKERFSCRRGVLLFLLLLCVSLSGADNGRYRLLFSLPFLFSFFFHLFSLPARPHAHKETRLCARVVFSSYWPALALLFCALVHYDTTILFAIFVSFSRGEQDEYAVKTEKALKFICM